MNHSFPIPVPGLWPNEVEFESTPVVHPNGFREYDARWWFGIPGSQQKPQLNLMGAQAVGMGLGTLLHRTGTPKHVVVGHDYRAYSGGIKMAFTAGLMAAGCHVHDIGLAITPMAYFAQFELDIAAVAMITASHNENGWTGFKMGMDRPVTFGPDDMAQLRNIVLAGDFESADTGQYSFHASLADRYIADLVDGREIKVPLRAVVACGNGTAAAFAPRVLEALGCTIIPLDTELDFTFPRYNPNPEDLTMLSVISETVLSTGADVGFGFDGDGDRCGVIDNQGRSIFADKVGVLLARDLLTKNGPSKFIVDVKSTALFQTDPALRRLNASVEYWKTGHSHMKRHVRDTQALAGFEKSGHFFFNAPLGRGYDDGLLTAIAVIEMLDQRPGDTMAHLHDSLPKTWSSPTMSPHCDDEKKYDVVAKVQNELEQMAENNQLLAGEHITNLLTVNGVRVTLQDGTWGLVRASSNKPELVVVVESPQSESRLRAMFDALDTLLSKHPEVGPYNQTLPA